MSRSALFRRLLDTITMASTPLPADEAVDVARVDRRTILKLGGFAAAASIVGCGAEDPLSRTRGTLRAVNADIGIVGAGIAGLSCAYELRRVGVSATVHEASDRVGGRIWSSNGPEWLGQAIERGGELIDTPHKTMIAYARELGLSLEDILKPVRDTFFRFNGARISEAALIEEYRVLVDAMRDDLRTLGSPTAALHTPQDEAFDRLSLAEWLDRKNAGPNIKKLLRVAYTIEYGLEPEEQSSLAFLFFAKASRQAKMRLFGNWSDERFHIVGGNQQVPIGLAAKMPGQIRLGRTLLAVKKLSDGRIELTFQEGSRTITARHDAVVLSLPFHLLREVSLDASLGLPDTKKYAIANVRYGSNSKLMIGFAGRPWIDAGCSGATYSDLPRLQASWETSPSTANVERAILTDYTGGNLANSLTPAGAQSHADGFLNDFEQLVPGAKARARRDNKGKYICHLEQWSSNPLTRGASTANQPGYFTTIAGHEATPVGNLYFAGETTDSFYSWQGFMEGGALSGLRAAGELSADFD
jgi:monoamine oxidase